MKLGLYLNNIGGVFFKNQRSPTEVVRPLPKAILITPALLMVADSKIKNQSPKVEAGKDQSQKVEDFENTYPESRISILSGIQPLLLAVRMDYYPG
jgi:hypothetical protein